jgi:hypothetical protein
MTYKRFALAVVIIAMGRSAHLQAQVAQAAQTMAVQALGNYAKGPQMMEQAISGLSVDVSFRFLDKTYENDVYVKDPVTGNRIRTACVRFKSTSGFAFKASGPSYTLTTQGLTVVQNIDKIDAEALNFSFQLGPCMSAGGGFGIKLRDVKLTYKARPTIKFENGGCRVSLNPIPDETRVSIGDMNILGVQNDLDKLAKDAVREALNVSLANFFNGGLGSGLARASISACGGGKRR